MSLDELETYLEGFKPAIAALASVEIGDEEEILNRQNSRIKYPCMWVETPAVSLISTPPGRMFKLAITFLYDVPKKDRKQERQRRSIALDIAEKAWTKLEDDEETGLFQLDSTRTEGDPITKWSGDNDTGYRFELTLTTGRNDC